MQKIEKFNTIHEMKDETKEKYIDILYENCKSEIRKFLQSNKDYIKKQLSGTAGRLFEDEVLKQDKLTKPFLRELIKKLDDKRSEKLNVKIIKAIIHEEKELADAIAINKEFDEQKLAAYLVKYDNKVLVFNLFECLGINNSITEKDLEDAMNNLVIGELQNLLEEKEKEIEKLKKKNKEDDAFFKKQLSEKEIELNRQNTELENEIKELKFKIKELENGSPIIPTIIDEKQTADEIITSVKRVDSTLEESLVEETKLSIDIETAIEDLESRTMLGVVRAEGIQPSKSWIVVTPIVPIISENANINREQFAEKIDYRSDYSTFMLFINPNLLRMCLFENDAENYQFYSNDEKFSCLFEAFCKKIIFFTPNFVKTSDGEKRKLNAKLIMKPVKWEDFNNSTYVPCYNVSKKEFENRVNKHGELTLENYPASLSSKLRYVFVKDTIYEINYVPVVDDPTGKYIRWKYNSPEGKPPFRKLDIKITNEVNDKYILTPSPWKDELDDLYVKNIMLIEPSTKTNTVFDEDEFIANISENARSKNLFYEEEDLKNFHVAIKSSNLVILAGPSGIGKTRLPMLYADTLGLNTARNTVLFVPISPSYLEPEDVLGYIKPISDETSNAEYMESKTSLVSFLIDAAEHKDRIHLVVFDEMNLSQIEHWFAPFISLLEQDPDSRVLNLYSNNLLVKNEEKYPSSINIGENVFFIGTVNIDETTKQISDRLLDRAIVINLAAPSFTNLKNMKVANTEIYPEITFSRFSTVVAKVDNAALEFNEKEFNLVNDLNTLLTESIYNKSISFRSLTKMALYLKNSIGILSRNEAIDFIISQIVVKKINGSKEELEGILSDDDTQGILKVLNDHSDVSEFVRTRRAVIQKIQEINKYGFTR